MASAVWPVSFPARYWNIKASRATNPLLVFLTDRQTRASAEFLFGIPALTNMRCRTDSKYAPFGLSRTSPGRNSMAGMDSILDRGGSSDSGKPPHGNVADRCLLSNPAPDRNNSDGPFEPVCSWNRFQPLAAQPVHSGRRRHPDHSRAEFRRLGATPSRKILERTNHSQSGPPRHPDRPICLGSASDL